MHFYSNILFFFVFYVEGNILFHDFTWRENVRLYAELWSSKLFSFEGLWNCFKTYDEGRKVDGHRKNQRLAFSVINFGRSSFSRLQNLANQFKIWRVAAPRCPATQLIKCFVKNREGFATVVPVRPNTQFSLQLRCKIVLNARPPYRHWVLSVWAWPTDACYLSWYAVPVGLFSLMLSSSAQATDQTFTINYELYVCFYYKL